MKKKFSIIFLLIIRLSLMGQSIVFNEVYDSGDSSQNGCDFVIELDSTGEFIMQMQYFGNGTNTNGAVVKKINANGVEINQIDINYNNHLMFGTGVLEDDNFLYSLFAYIDPNEDNKFDTYFVKLNQNLDTIYSKVIDIGYHDAGNSIKKINNNELVFLSYYYPDSNIFENSQVVMVTIDTLGNVLDLWEYGGPGYDIAYDYKQTTDGGYIIGGRTRDSTNANRDLFLLKIDSIGTEEWYHKYSTINDELVRSWNYIETLQDGGYIIAAEEYIYNPFPQVVSLIIKTDSLGVKLWEKKTYINDDNTFSKSVRINHDQTIILTGGFFYDSLGLNIVTTPTKGFLNKYTPDGNTLIWEREYVKIGIGNEYVHDMLLTKDGGILVSGYLYAFITRNDGWLVKFDSCGYTVGDIPEPMLIIDSVIDKTVYITDQSTNYCSAAIDWGDGTETQPYYAYENNQPLAEKHFSHTYSQIDDYTITTTTLAGEEFRDYEVQVLGLNTESVISNAERNLPSIFPNPSNNYIIVENSYSGKIPNQVGNDGSFKMTIHNLNGKQVKSTNLNPKLYQQKIDVSSLNNGVYLVRFEMDGQFLGTEKLVVAR